MISFVGSEDSRGEWRLKLRSVLAAVSSFGGVMLEMIGSWQGYECEFSFPSGLLLFSLVYDGIEGILSLWTLLDFFNQSMIKLQDEPDILEVRTEIHVERV